MPEEGARGLAAGSPASPAARPWPSRSRASSGAAPRFFEYGSIVDSKKATDSHRWPAPGRARSPGPRLLREDAEDEARSARPTGPTSPRCSGCSATSPATAEPRARAGDGARRPRSRGDALDRVAQPGPDQDLPRCRARSEEGVSKGFTGTASSRGRDARGADARLREASPTPPRWPPGRGDATPPQHRTYLPGRSSARRCWPMPRRFSEASFAFYSKALTGAKEELARWKKCVAATDAALGEALAVPFVQRTFGEDGKSAPPRPWSRASPRPSRPTSTDRAGWTPGPRPRAETR